MSILSSAITSLSHLIGNYGIAIVIAVVLYYIVTLPIRTLSQRHKQKKQSCAPELIAIRKKYNANALGVSFEDSPGMSSEVKAMSHEERENSMADEIAEVYKKHGYKMWAGFVFGAISFICIIALYIAIRESNPGGIYANTWTTIANQDSPTFAYGVFIAALGSVVISNVYATISEAIRSKKSEKGVKSSLIAGLIALLLNVIFMLLVLKTASVAITIAITTLQALSLMQMVIRNIATCIHGRRK